MPPTDDTDVSDIRLLADRIAKQLTRKLNMDPPTRAAFLDDVAGWIPDLMAKHEPDQCEFGGWCYTFLHNKAVDLFRTRDRDRRNLEKLKAQAVAGGFSHPRHDREGPEPDEPPPAHVVVTILDRVARPRDRVILALDYGVTASLALERIERWVADAGIDLPDEFPWRDIVAIADDTDRRKALAASLDTSMTALRQRIRRALQNVRETLEDGRP